MKRLLVNADDFGLSRGITDGIVEAHQRGIVTSTSIVAGGTDFEHAVEQARMHPELGVGVHLTLVEERPVSAARDIETLVEHDGRLPRNYGALLPGLVLGRIRLRHVEVEFRAQIEKCLHAGLQPTHLDSHQHAHALPSLFRMVLRLAKEYGIRGIRIPRDAPKWSSGLGAGGFAQKYALCLLARYDASAVRRAKMLACSQAVGIFDSGELSEERLLRILDRLPEGETELVCHPGLKDAELTAAYGHWKYQWQEELRALTSARVLESLLAKGITLINYRALTG